MYSLKYFTFSLYYRYTHQFTYRGLDCKHKLLIYALTDDLYELVTDLIIIQKLIKLK